MTHSFASRDVELDETGSYIRFLLVKIIVTTCYLFQLLPFRMFRFGKLVVLCWCGLCYELSFASDISFRSPAASQKQRYSKR